MSPVVPIYTSHRTVVSYMPLTVWKGDGIAIFSIDLENGQLTKIGYQLTGIHPRNFVITPNGKFLLCACRDSHIVQVYEIDKQSGLLKDTGKDIRVSKPVCLKFTDM